MNWIPSPEPTRYDKARVARLRPIRAELEKLGLPLLRLRKLNSILGALEVQIEDGGDHPELNKLLLAALRVGILHQVGQSQARSVLQAIDAFERAEAKRWEQVKTNTLPPLELDPEDKLDDLIHEGYTLIYDKRQLTKGCDRWLEAWELIKQMATPAMVSVKAFDRVYPLTQSIYNWSSDMEMELGNAGLGNALYNQHCIRFVREYLAQFSEDEDHYVNMRRAEGEALWRLGRQAEAEAVYRALIEKLPDEAWAYIGWADNYYLWRNSAKDYASAEAILRQALARPTLQDRQDVLQRLIDLYEEWGQPEKQALLLAELARNQAGNQIWSQVARTKLAQQGQPPPPAPSKPKRNDPCWCGSGKKYKHCHLKSDQSH